MASRRDRRRERAQLAAAQNAQRVDQPVDPIVEGERKPDGIELLDPANGNGAARAVGDGASRGSEEVESIEKIDRSDAAQGVAVAEEAEEAEAEEERRVNFVSVNDLHRGCYVLMKGSFPCKVVEVARSKQGKHGSAKVSIVGLDIFTGRKFEDLYPSSKTVEVPEVHKLDLEVLGIEGGRLLVKNHKDGKAHHPVPLPEDDIGARVRTLLAAQATVVVQLQCAMGKEKIVQAREKRAR